MTDDTVAMRRLLEAIEFVGDPLSDRPVPSWALDCGDDCPLPRHRWNCYMTPLFAQTIRDLDTNPWTVTDGAMFPIQTSRINHGFHWDGENGRYCGKGPCCMFDGHDGRCRM